MDKRHTIIQGTWAYSAPRLKKQGNLVVGSTITLRREPNNLHDRNAAAVFLGRSKVGYLPRGLAAELATYLDNGGNYNGEISQVGTHTYKGNIYPSVYVDLVFAKLDPPDGLSNLLHIASSLEGERGVYRIENTVDQRSYIGSSGDVGKRLHGHITQLRNGNHPNHRLTEGWIRSGPRAFKISLMERVTGHGLREREKFHIQRLETHRYGYNQTADGEGAPPLPASERSRLGLDQLPPSRPSQSSHPTHAKPPSQSPKAKKTAQGCLVLILFCAGIAGAGIRQLLASTPRDGEQAPGGQPAARIESQ